MGDSAPSWGDRDACNFVKTLHHEISPAIDPSKVSLPKPFVVCIVGASRGIGAGIALSYAKAGASGLILAARRITGLEETAEKCRKLSPGVEIEVVGCDITSYESVDSLANKTKGRFGRLDVLIVNSGYSGDASLRAIKGDPSSLQNAINVNYVGTAFCAMALVPLLLSTEDGAKSFIAISSMASFIVRGPIANAQYCASKAAQLRYMEMVHEESSEQGLMAVSIHPGAVWTEMAEQTAPKEFEKYCVDDPELCGAWCVWMTKEKGKYSWLSGRFVSANWDVEEFEARKKEVVDGDLLKMKVAV